MYYTHKEKIPKEYVGKYICITDKIKQEPQNRTVI